MQLGYTRGGRSYDQSSQHTNYCTVFTWREGAYCSASAECQSCQHQPARPVPNMTGSGLIRSLGSGHAAASSCLRKASSAFVLGVGQTSGESSASIVSASKISLLKSGHIEARCAFSSSRELMWYRLLAVQCREWQTYAVKQQTAQSKTITVPSMTASRVFSPPSAPLVRRAAARSVTPAAVVGTWYTRSSPGSGHVGARGAGPGGAGALRVN